MDLVVEAVADDQKVEDVDLLLDVPSFDEHRHQLADLHVAVRRHAQKPKTVGGRQNLEWLQKFATGSNIETR